MLRICMLCPGGRDSHCTHRAPIIPCICFVGGGWGEHTRSQEDPPFGSIMDLWELCRL